MTSKELAKVIRAKVIGADSVSVNKMGDVVVRLGFFYRMGGTVEKFEKSITAQLKGLGIDATVTDKGEVWKGFNGGASVARSSHWWVTLNAEVTR